MYFKESDGFQNWFPWNSVYFRFDFRSRSYFIFSILQIFSMKDRFSFLFDIAWWWSQESYGDFKTRVSCVLFEQCELRTAWSVHFWRSLKSMFFRSAHFRLKIIAQLLASFRCFFVSDVWYFCTNLIVYWHRMAASSHSRLRFESWIDFFQWPYAWIWRCSWRCLQFLNQWFDSENIPVFSLVWIGRI